MKPFCLSARKVLVDMHSTTVILGFLVSLGIILFACLSYLDIKNSEKKGDKKDVDSINKSLRANSANPIEIRPNAEIGNSQNKQGQYRIKNELMSRVELILYQRILEALPEYMVFSQVAMNRIVFSEEKGVRGKTNFSHYGKIRDKSIDFLICDSESRLIAAIELDDYSHTYEHRQKADMQKNDALKEANIRLIRFQASKLPTIADIRSLFISEKELNNV